MSGGLMARRAEPGDAPAIAQIYNQGIEDRVATFETDLRTAEAIAALLISQAERYPAPDASGAGRATRAFKTLTA
jgi:L-amino acid N-acyltransferase YncA